MKWSREFKRHREAQCFETGRIAIKRTWSKLKYQTDEKKNEIHLRYVYSCTCNICVIEKNKNGYTKTDSRWPWADMSSERYENIRINTDIYILFVVCDVSFLLCGGRQVCWVWAARLLPRQILIFFFDFSCMRLATRLEKQSGFYCWDENVIKIYILSVVVDGMRTKGSHEIAILLWCRMDEEGTERRCKHRFLPLHTNHSGIMHGKIVDPRFACCERTSNATHASL